MEHVYISTRHNGKPYLSLHLIELAVAKEEPINFDVYGYQARYVPERTCEFVETREVESDYDAWTERKCKCGEWIDVTRRFSPNYCPRCGAKVVE